MTIQISEQKEIKVIKRNGDVVDFNSDKIVKAINGALGDTTEYIDETRSASLEKILTKDINIKAEENEGRIHIEEIQNIIEQTLLVVGLEDTHEAFKNYRETRRFGRERFTSPKHIKQMAINLENIGINQAAASDIKRENANVDGNSAMGIMLQTGSTVSKSLVHAYQLSDKSSEGHLDGDFHIHDLDFAMTGTTTCLQIDLEKLFSGGFNTGHGVIREPQSIASYASLAAIAIQANQNDQHGGQSIPMFDYYMAPGVLKTFRKELSKIITQWHNIKFGEGDYEIDANELAQSLDKLKGIDDQDTIERIRYCIHEMDDATFERLVKEAKATTVKATYQAMEGFIHNLNTMNSRAGAQVPFSSINFGTDISPEGRLVTEQYLLALEAGLGNGETPIFPISIFKVKDGVNYLEDDPNLDLFDLACRVSAKRMFPNFSFIDAPFNLEYYKEGKPETEVAYMGCRTRVMSDINDPEDQRVTGRGNLSFTTVNLPKLAIVNGFLDKDSLTNEFNKDKFFAALDEQMEIVKDQLLDRYNYQIKRDVTNFPFLLGQGNWKNSENLESGDSLESSLKHGTLSIGFIGLAEALVALIGEHHGESEEAQELGLEIIQYMRDKVDAYAKEYKLNFSLIATPAEGLSGRFVNMDRKQFGSIPGITDREYYTNSFHVPVYHSIASYAKVNKEAPYHALTNAGHITYVELDGDLQKNQQALKSVVAMMKEAGIGYGAINHPLDMDPVCGYSGIIHEQCPGCGRTEEDGIKFNRIRRITGYLVGTLDRFNNAKKAEESERVKHGSAK